MNYIDCVKQQIRMYTTLVSTCAISYGITRYFVGGTSPEITTNHMVMFVTWTFLHIFITPLYNKWFFNEWFSPLYNKWFFDKWFLKK